MQTPENQKQPEQNTVIKEIFSWIKVVIGSIVVVFLLNTFVIAGIRVPTGSMMNTIQKGDKLYNLKIAYMLSDPQRGDIAVFYYPVDYALGNKTEYIKRVIGLPGETVEIRDSKVYITPADNSETFELDEPYLKDKGDAWTVANGSENFMIFHVPEDSYFMMGDNRNNSRDGRYWSMCAIEEFAKAGKNIAIEDALSLQFVNRDLIIGKAWI